MTYAILINFRDLSTTVIIMSLTNLMVAPDLIQHSVMDRVRHMAIGTAEHMLVLIPQVIDMERRPEAHRQSCDGRPHSDLYNYDHYNERSINDHTNYGHNAQQYMDRFVNPSYNQRQNNDIHSTYVSYQKIY